MRRSEPMLVPFPRYGGTFLSRALGPWVGAVIDTLAECQKRRLGRLILQQMDDQMLSDIGMSRADVEREISRPFWR